MINAGMMTSSTDLWETPQDFFDKLNMEFGFELDVCALPENAKCERYYTPKDNGLLMRWEGVCWMNPPYGRHIGRWVKKAYQEAKSGCATVISLLPARTDTKWVQDYCLKSNDIRFIRGRLKFGGSTNSAPFQSVVVVFSKQMKKGVEDMEQQKYPQDEERNEYRYISPSWVDAIACGLTAGAKKHPGETWKTIPPDEHLSRAMRHINLYRLGDRSEPHIINASMRLMMAFCTVKNDEVMDALGLSYEKEEKRNEADT